MSDIAPQILSSLFLPDEIGRLQLMLDHCAWDKIKIDDVADQEQVQYRHKQIHYNHERSPFRRIIYPKIAGVIGDHLCSHSIYNEVQRPSYVHVDTCSQLNQIDVAQTTEPGNTALLICMSEHHSFKTAFFDHRPPGGLYQLGDHLPDSGQDNDSTLMDLLDHHPAALFQQLGRLAIADVLPWSIGSVLMWDRRQLHCSTNFRKHTDLVKKFILLFV